jgi:hypothetical protein
VERGSLLDIIRKQPHELTLERSIGLLAGVAKGTLSLSLSAASTIYHFFGVCSRARTGMAFIHGQKPPILHRDMKVRCVRACARGMRSNQSSPATFWSRSTGKQRSSLVPSVWVCCNAYGRRLRTLASVVRSTRELSRSGREPVRVSLSPKISISLSVYEGISRFGPLLTMQAIQA